MGRRMRRIGERREVQAALRSSSWVEAGGDTQHRLQLGEEAAPFAPWGGPAPGCPCGASCPLAKLNEIGESALVIELSFRWCIYGENLNLNTIFTKLCVRISTPNLTPAWPGAGERRRDDGAARQLTSTDDEVPPREQASSSRVKASANNPRLTSGSTDSGRE